MYITKLRLIGFKSFVEPTELLIEQGLTGVVGPNGCGKSNLLEALRWVMGETSHKSMRASAMDDVIFSGTSGRPARAMAEVTIFVDNTRRLAPAEFNDSDDIEITRRIEREQGSNYRINAREARARDVRILFEDAASGARSPSLVRQGQIGEIVNAKPEQRRRILEDAAGIAGLHSRRHEAELRLKAAENNLARIADILGQLQSQLDALKRQARQARRYGDLSRSIREMEALQLFLTWQQAQSEVDREETALRDTLEALGLATRTEAEAIRAEAEAASTIDPLREQETIRAAVVARLRNEAESLEKDAERARARCTELGERAAQIENDLGREKSLVSEAGDLQVRLRESLASLASSDDGEAERAAALDQRLTQCQGDSTAAEQAFNEKTAELSRARTESSAIEASLRERQRIAERLAEQSATLHKQAEAIAKSVPDAAQHQALETRVTEARQAVSDAESEVQRTEALLTEADAKARVALEQREAATLAHRQIETEKATLSRLLERPETDEEPIVDAMTVKAGLETALGAALGDDLEAPISSQAAIHWRRIAPHDDLHDDDPALPDGAAPLTNFVDAPPELHRRLRQTGLVDGDAGEKLQSLLLPGQRLVTLEGALWRWDGFVASPDAPTAAAQRLALRNRLTVLEKQEREARAAEQAAAATAEAAADTARQARAAEQDARRRWQDAQRAELAATRELSAHDQAAREARSRLEAVTEAATRATAEHEAATSACAEQEQALAALPDPMPLEAAAEAARDTVTAMRDKLALVRAEKASLERERNHRSAQRAAIEADLARWSARAEQGVAQISALEQRLEATKRELAEISALPESIDARREALTQDVERAERERREAADRMVQADAVMKECAAALRTAREAVGVQREARARVEARLEGARTKRQEISQKIATTLETTPEGCLQLAGHPPDTPLPALGEIDARLERLKAERNRLGGVNLQAEEELKAMDAEFTALDQERADVEAAVQKLRGGISSLNREGRKRLREAFERVDGHFRDLFTTLFGGGEARLELIDDAEDPLAGGLEIIARPPGKKPATLSLLSGGEQTLTALSLIFAVFLTNPSPICVLDEVDAPLDDANVDRFCTLMEKMAAETDTRFLVITHHPMTMARMDRLFGVTMVEKGVSQLVSVDLTTAESFVEAV